MTYTTQNQKNAQQIGKWDYKYAYKFAFTLSVIFLFLRQIMTVGFLKYNY